MSEKTAISTPEALFEAIGELLERVIDYGPCVMPDAERLAMCEQGLAAIREFQRHVERAARPAAEKKTRERRATAGDWDPGDIPLGGGYSPGKVEPRPAEGD